MGKCWLPVVLAAEALSRRQRSSILPLGAFTLTGNMTSPRFLHTVTLLSDGRVIVVGEATGSGVASTAELYNPATGTLAPTGAGRWLTGIGVNARFRTWPSALGTMRTSQERKLS